MLSTSPLTCTKDTFYKKNGLRLKQPKPIPPSPRGKSVCFNQPFDKIEGKGKENAFAGIVQTAAEGSDNVGRPLQRLLLFEVSFV